MPLFRILPLACCIACILSAQAFAPAIAQQTETSSLQTAKMREVVRATSEGRDFWVCFQKNSIEPERDPRTNRINPREIIALELFLTSGEDTKVVIEIEGLLFRQETRIRAGTVVNIKIDTAAQVRTSETPERLAVHITAEKPISVYGLSHRYQTTDTFMGLPLEALGTVYRSINYHKLREDLISQIAIIATQDSTRVTITPKSPTYLKKPANVPFTVSLHKGDVYQVIGSTPSGSSSSSSRGTASDLTGTLIESNKPIAVFSGHNGAYIPFPDKGYNHLVEQLPPISAWGRHYYVGTLLGRTKSTVRVVAAEDDTKIFSNGQQVATLAAGEYYENSNLTAPTQITGDKRILVAQYAHGFENALDSIGDPMMILLTPTQQFLKKYRFLTPIRGQWHHYVNIVAPREGIESLKLDGNPMNVQAFKSFGESRYMIAQIEVPYGTHTLESKENFGLYSYGFGYGDDSYDAYGNMVGQSFLELREVRDTLPPLATLRASTLPTTIGSSGGGGARSSVASSRTSTRTAIAPQISKIIASDDREDDRGLAAVRVVDAGGLDLIIPSISAGQPQAEIILHEQAQRQSGRAILEFVDVAGNTSRYTLCFTKDQIGSDNLVALNEGIQDYCPQKTLWYWGAFGIAAATIHEASFSSFDRFRTPGTFTGTADGIALPTGGGVALGHRLSPLFGVSLKLAGEIFPGSLRSPDPANANPAHDTLALGLDGRPLVLQQGYTLALTSIYASATLAGEVYFSNIIYALAGLKASFALTRTLALNRTVIAPHNFVFPQTNTRERPVFAGESASVASVIPFLVGGIGASVPIWRNIAAFGEIAYSHGIGSAMSDQDWRIAQLTLTLGARFRF